MYARIAIRNSMSSITLQLIPCCSDKTFFFHHDWRLTEVRFTPSVMKTALPQSQVGFICQGQCDIADKVVLHRIYCILDTTRKTNPITCFTCLLSVMYHSYRRPKILVICRDRFSRYFLRQFPWFLVRKQKPTKPTYVQCEVEKPIIPRLY